MGADTSPPSSDGTPSTSTRDRARAWWQGHDPGLRATKRSVRAALLVPAVFAIAVFGVGNAQTSLFAVFGSLALLLFVDFAGPAPARLRAYSGLWIVSAVLIAVATLCSTHVGLAAVAMALVGFVVLFAGIVSPRAVAAATAVLLTFVLPVAVPAGASAIPDRLLGWALAGAICIPAALLVWTGRWHDPLRARLADAADAVADLLDVLAAAGDTDDARVGMDHSIRELRAQYEATPYRPTGAGPTDVALTNLVSQVEWVGARVRDITPSTTTDPGGQVAGVESAAAEVLAQVATLLRARASATVGGDSDMLAAGVDRLRAARVAATDAAVAHLAGGAVAPQPRGPESGGTDVVSSIRDIDPGFPVRMVAFAVEQLTDVARDALGIRRRDASLPDRWSATVRSYRQVAAVHLTARSVWFRNSLRGAVALAIAVAVADASTLQHGFWVVLGTLSVLRSNALGTGSTAVRAVVGTALGFVLGSAILVALSTHDAYLWAVLPFAVLVAGIAPAAISFTAGQAGFTVLVVVVFNIIDPVGSSIGLVRIEDVAIGTAVSVVVGVLFWPRGAAVELAGSLVQGYQAATGWLVAAIDHVGREDPAGDGSPDRRRSAAAAQRLDDAYREFLSERGAKQVPLAAVTHLLTGCAAIRLSARTLEHLPVLTAPGGGPPIAEVVEARATVTASCRSMEGWFCGVAGSLGDRSLAVAAPEPADPRLHSELLEAWSAARRDGRREGVFAVLRLLWVEERLDDLRQLQTELASTAPELA